MNKLSTLIGSVVTALVMGLGLSPDEAERRVRIETCTLGDGSSFSTAKVMEEYACCDEHEYADFVSRAATAEIACESLLEQVLQEVMLRGEIRREDSLNPNWFEVEGRLSGRHAQNAAQPVGTVVRGDKLQRSRSARRASRDVLRYEVDTYGGFRDLGAVEGWS